MSTTNCTTTHAIMFFFLLSLVLLRTRDFFSSPKPPTKPSLPATTSTLLPFLSGILFTVVCTLILKFPIRSFFLRIKPTPPSRDPSPEPSTPTTATGGISTPLLNSLPIFAYSSEKPPRFGKAATGLCAICLSEFRDEQTLRWLPDCDHLFHRRCVDTWLGSHKTCPCCRANVERCSASSSGCEVLMLEDGGGDSPASFGDDRRRSGCERSVVSGLIRVLIGRRRHHATRPRHR